LDFSFRIAWTRLARSSKEVRTFWGEYALTLLSDVRVSPAKALTMAFLTDL
jgi:hypothetical protein